MTDNPEPQQDPQPRFGEFVVRTALMISLVALSIDAMLPALPLIGADLGVRHANDNQLVISALFLGLAAGQLIYGPLSDSTGRKPPIYAGFLLFAMGCVLSIVASSFPMMLAGRFLQGLGAAGPRTVAIALVRDRYEGRAMARVMSMIMAAFILVPAVAPALGQGILFIAPWRAIFGVLLALALIVSAWFGLRQPETLPQKLRRPFSLGRIGHAMRETCFNRAAFGYTVTAGLIFSALVGYLNSAQQIFQEQFALGARFPLYFGALALSVGAASFLNARLVMHYGMRPLSWRALQVFSAVSIAFFLWAGFLRVSAGAGNPPLWAVMTWGMTAFFAMGILFGNFNAMALESLGHIAGVASSVVGFLTTLISLLLGALIGQAYNGTVLPLVGGFALLGVASLLVMHWAERGRETP